jgi:ABC-type nitrate/sulfonate/bicarbonate transport system substrate-binding protein
MPRTSGADRSDENDPKRAFGNMDRNFKNDVASAPKSEDEIMLLRRKFLYLFAGVTTMPLSSIAQAQVSPRTSQSVRVATGLLATWQSTAWLGAEAGVFKKRGIDMTLPAIAVGGPEAAAGLVRGDWEFAHTGTVPVAEEVLKGRDVVILATPTSDFPKSFVMTRKEITRLAQLDGKKVGVLTESGQTSVATRITVEKAGATATYLPLIKFDRIYAALAARETRSRTCWSDVSIACGAATVSASAVLNGSNVTPRMR